MGIDKVKAVIVDDEKLARDDLKALLQNIDDVTVIGEAYSVTSALTVIKRDKPDIVFLDIKMPGSSGFELIDKIDSSIKIVFITAFDDYAVKAFEVNALDYLIKPVDPERLEQTIEKIISSTQNYSNKKFEINDSVFIKLGSKHMFLKISSILCITAASDYTELTTINYDKGLLLQTMKEWENKLPHQMFSRIHRSTIININYIDKIEEWFNFTYKIYMKGIKKPFVMSRTYAAKNKGRFK